MKIVLAIAVGVALIAGCATAPQGPAPRHITIPFDEDHAARLMQSGPNAIKGNAFMRQRGGGVVTCAGLQVTLIPATNYAKERVSALYGSSSGGATKNQYTFTPNPQAYHSLTKRTSCDAQGNFQFDNVADGEFYVHATVAWEVARSLQGGNMIQLVSLKGGQALSIVISG